jgi:hypothetical protein
VTALIGFVRELAKELRSRADALDSPGNHSAVAEVLREIGGAVESAAKRTFLS